MVAVLFTDLVGSTDLMVRLGDAAFDELRRTHFAALAKPSNAPAARRSRTPATASWRRSPRSPTPSAVPSPCSRRRSGRHAGRPPIAIRVGLSVGEVTFEGDDVFGTPVVEAARLVAAAASGQILTTAIVKALAAGRTDADVRGPRCPRAEGAAPAGRGRRGALGAASRALVPMPGLLTDVGRIFVGRDDQLERLDQLWKEVAAGERRVALLAGEPGVGKTRLAAELAGAVHEEGATVLAGRCDEDLGVPYQPFVEALRHYVAHTPPENLPDGLGRYGGELARLVPEAGGAGPRSGATAAVGPRDRALPPLRCRRRVAGSRDGRPARAADHRRPPMGGQADAAPPPPRRAVRRHGADPRPRHLPGHRARPRPSPGGGPGRPPPQDGRGAPVAASASIPRGWPPSWSRPPGTNSTTTTWPWPGPSTRRPRATPSSSGRCSAIWPRREP